MYPSNSAIKEISLDYSTVTRHCTGPKTQY